MTLKCPFRQIEMSRYLNSISQNKDSRLSFRETFSALLRSQNQGRAIGRIVASALLAFVSNMSDCLTSLDGCLYLSLSVREVRSTEEVQHASC